MFLLFAIMPAGGVGSFNAAYLHCLVESQNGVTELFDLAASFYFIFFKGTLKYF